MSTAVTGGAMASGRTWALIRAFLIAPLVTPVVFVSLRALQGFSPSGDFKTICVDLAAGLFMFTMIAYVATVILGIPLFLVFERLGIRSMLGYSAGGFFISLITTVVLSATTGGLFRGEHSLSALALTTLVLFVSGGGAGVVFKVRAFGR
jgi:hypothetical protein